MTMLVEKTIPLGTRVPESDYAEITEAAGGNLAQFVRDAVAEKMAQLGRPISATVGTKGGRQAGAGRPVGAVDRQQRKRRASNTRIEQAS